MNDLYIWTGIAVTALVTALLRFVPFWVFGNRKTPPWLQKLGQSLPYAIMGMLVVYCLKDVQFASVDGWLPPLIGVVIVAALYAWTRNTLAAILAGTVCYMVLVQAVF